MKAMILAAGRGTRLRPLTNYQPKALVKVAGVPLLELVIRQLIRQGCREIIVNVHHFGEQIIQFLEKKDHFGIKIAVSDEQDQLLETGGGLKKASAFFDDGRPFLLCNTDILSDLDLNDFYQRHCKSGAIATLATQWRDTSRYLVFNQDLVLNGWVNVKTGELKLPHHSGEAWQMQAFCGLHVIDPRLFAYMTEEGPFSIIDTYLKACATETILAYPTDGQRWVDVGRQSSLETAEPLAKWILEQG